MTGIKGKPLTKAHKLKLSLALNGIKRYPFTDAHKKKLSDAKIGVYENEKHPQWKGDRASYRAIHKWVERKLGTPRKCQKCKLIILGQHRMHWANISRKYQRNLQDWIRLCSSCHGKFDTGKRRKLTIN